MMIDANGVFAGHPIEFIPIWIGQVWRVLLLAAEAALLGRIIAGFVSPRSEIRYLEWHRRVAWLCVGLYTARAAWVSIFRFDDMLVYEGAPVTTAAVACGLIAVYQVGGNRDKKDVVASNAQSPSTPHEVIQ